MRNDHRKMMCLDDALNDLFIRVKAKVEQRERIKVTDTRVMRLAILALAKQERVRTQKSPTVRQGSSVGG